MSTLALARILLKLPEMGDDLPIIFFFFLFFFHQFLQKKKNLQIKSKKLYINPIFLLVL